jgi:hypothetical protein
MAYYSSPHEPCLQRQTAAFLQRILNVLILNRLDKFLRPVRSERLNAGKYLHTFTNKTAQSSSSQAE